MNEPAIINIALCAACKNAGIEVPEANCAQHDQSWLQQYQGGSRYFAPKYQGWMPSAKVAALVRADIKDAIAKGILPKGLKVSVRSEHYSGGQSVNARIMAVPDGFEFLNEERVKFEVANPHAYPDGLSVFNEAGEALLKQVQAMVKAYNHDGSDLQVDYHDVMYYGFADYDWQMRNAAVDAIKARLASPSM